MTECFEHAQAFGEGPWESAFAQPFSKSEVER